MSPQAADPQPPGSGKLGWLAFGYALLIVYGSLLPFSGWRPPPAWSNPLLTLWPDFDPDADVLVNVLAYVPLGMLLCWTWIRGGLVQSILFPVAAGFALSFCVELLQEALPSRVSSARDIFNNTLGSLVGSLIAIGLSSDRLPGRWLHAWRARHLLPGLLPLLGCAAILLWVAAELFPYLPSTNPQVIKAGLHPFAHTLRHPGLFSIPEALVEGASMLGVGILARLILRGPVMPMLVVLMLGVMAFKVLIAFRILSLEFFCAALASLAVVTPLTRQNRRALAWLGLAAVSLAKIVDELQPGYSPDWFFPFNWKPFAYHAGSLAGMNDILSALWLAMALAVFARYIAGDRLRPRTGLLGGAALFGVWFMLEWHQRTLPGRLPDITDPLLGVLAWWAALALREHRDSR